MKRVFAGLALAGLAASLGACVYYPHGPYGPGYGPPPPADGGPPPGADYGPPPGGQGGPPPGYGQEGPPQGDEESGPQGAEMRPLTQQQIAKINDPTWCNAHPRHCQKLRSQYAAEHGGQGGPPPQGAYGPPQGGQYQGAPQGGQYQGPPPAQQ